MSVLDQASLWGRAAPAERSAWRLPLGHRLAAEAAALIQPTLGVRGVASGIAPGSEINRACRHGAPLELRRGGAVVDMLGGCLCVVIGSKASRPCEGCAVTGDD